MLYADAAPTVVAHTATDSIAPAAGATAPAASRAERLRRHQVTPYADALDRYIQRNPVQLMVPGHGGSDLGLSTKLAGFLGERTLQLDVPMLLEGIDLESESPLDAALALAADAWGAKRTWFLTNGASQANRTAALAARGLGEHLLAQRSAHSSFSDGVLLAGITPSYVFPTVDAAHGMAHGVSPAALDEALTLAAAEGRAAAAVYVISPSYFGSVSDVRGLADIAHAHGAPLIVDGAWGPHFGFHPELPESPARLGADLVISSTHKLAGSLTQSAMLHLGHGPLAAQLEPFVERALSMTSSTSTSSIMRASLDIARSALATGEEAIGHSVEVAQRFREILRADPRFDVVSDHFDRFTDIVETDVLRVPIDVSAVGVSAHWLRNRLIEDHALFFEMATATTLVAVIGAGKTPDVDAVYAALDAVVESDAAAAERASNAATEAFPPMPVPGARRLTPRDGFFGDTELVSAEAAIGRVSADTLAAYPPGIPNVMPGEEITPEAVGFLQAVAASPTGYVRGALDAGVTQFRVIRDPQGPEA
ncbi:arginine/lysine/ornithine decarboxylase [Leucobacter luti]|uniref:aminotransferase class I/II-fold pyridoxal phosphate-dependent enzyme n=1 Tax=Leucobacter luti TaxID=340320 RepID=UPI00104F2441|nr:amino acid decarboxylase [Leucobacter luti]MCW2288195.1 arginine/lysine/ornithine decarboxylase [Leucobacter luti]TCK45645.1 arginine/lysine/ornithine decarboxylase [Leucobacter luti]